jgi:Flp pilus assembly protein TadG
MQPRLTWWRKAENRNRRGNNLIEFTFLAPWYIFLFVGSFDMGLYGYALIGVENAARVGALVCSASSTTCPNATIPCGFAIDQLKSLPNMGSAVTTCAASPLTVTVSQVSGPDGQSASQVTVTYVTPALASIPGILPGQYTATRTIVMRNRS